MQRYKKYYIDSSKFLLDSDLLKKINIPEDYYLVDADTGDVLRHFKKKSLEVFIPERKCSVYIAHYTKVLRGKHYNKFMLLASAKCAKEYFKGITKDTLVYILKYLRNQKHYILFDDAQINTIVDNVYLKDTDITQNYIYSSDDTKEFINNFKNIRASAVLKDKIKIFNTSKNQGIQFGTRGDRYFFKVYNKSLEIDSELDFMPNVSLKDREVLWGNTVWRFELTLRNSKDYERFGISNKFVDLLELVKAQEGQDKITEIKREYFNYYIGNYMPKQIQKREELSPTHKGMLHCLIKVRDVYNFNVYQLETWFLSAYDDKGQRYRMKKLFYKLMDILYLEDESPLVKELKNKDKVYSQVMSIFLS